MKEITLEEMKQMELQMFICFDKVCRDNNIKYSIAYGTLIGAIRHKGFIPWDDDIDVIMCREEYDKFLSVWKDGKYKLLTLKKGSDFYPLLSRLTDPRTQLDPPRICNHGVWVAIIPYDKVPDNKKEYDRQMRKVSWLMSMLSIKSSNLQAEMPLPKKMLFGLLKLFLMPFSPYAIGKRVERIKTKYKGYNYKRVKPWDNTSKILVNADIFDDYVDLDFEGVKAMATAKYDYILRFEYGDYMKLPPEEERVPKHGFKAYWK